MSFGLFTSDLAAQFAVSVTIKSSFSYSLNFAVSVTLSRLLKNEKSSKSDKENYLSQADHTHQLEIKSIMDTWSRQSGYPVLTVTKDGEDLVISQKSFLLAKAESAKKSKKNKGMKKGEDEDDKVPEE